MTINMLNHPIIHNADTVPFNKTVQFQLHKWLAESSGIDTQKAKAFSACVRPQYLWFNPLTAESEIVDDHAAIMLNYMQLTDKPDDQHR